MSEVEIGIGVRDRGEDAGERAEPEERVIRRYPSPEAVFRASYDRLVQTLTLVAGDREVAADAVQEGFIRLVREWRKISTYDDPVAWVYRVALNLVRDHHRSLGRLARLLLRLGREAALEGGAAEENNGAPLSATAVGDALRALPTKQREAVALCCVGDLTRRAAAEVMGVSEGSLSQHLHRAKEALRARMEKTS